jgi:ABC-type arginine transport system permease subunit
MSKRKLTFAAKTREIMMEDKFYWYGIAAAVYIVTCWVFSVVRAVHNCGTPKER